MPLMSSFGPRALLAGALAAWLPVSTPARPVPQTDTQWWQEVDLVGSLPQNLSYGVAGFSRLSESDPNPALVGGGGFITWSHGALGATIGYLHADARLAPSGRRLNVDLPLAAITGTLKCEYFALSDRLRIEDLMGVPGDPWRYRNLLSFVASPRRVGRWKALAISDEVFIDLSSEHWTRNRLLAGPVVTLSDRIDLALDYLNERDVGGSPGRIHGAFVDFAIRL